MYCLNFLPEVYEKTIYAWNNSSALYLELEKKGIKKVGDRERGGASNCSLGHVYNNKARILTAVRSSGIYVFLGNLYFLTFVRHTLISKGKALEVRTLNVKLFLLVTTA